MAKQKQKGNSMKDKIDSLINELKSAPDKAKELIEKHAYDKVIKKIEASGMSIEDIKHDRLQELVTEEKQKTVNYLKGAGHTIAVLGVLDILTSF